METLHGMEYGHNFKNCFSLTVIQKIHNFGNKEYDKLNLRKCEIKHLNFK